MRPDGQDRIAIAGPNPFLSDASWCGGSDRVFIASYNPEGRKEVHLFDRLEGHLNPIARPGLRYNGWIECAPDGRHFLASAVVGRERRVVLGDLEGGDYQVLPADIFEGDARVRWPPPTPVAVSVSVTERCAPRPGRLDHITSTGGAKLHNLPDLMAEGLIDQLPGAKGPHPNRVSDEVEKAILEHCLAHPPPTSDGA